MDKTKFLVSAEPIAREVELPDGSVELCHFKQASAGEFRRWRMAEESPDEHERLFAMQMLIAASLWEVGQGKLAMTKEEATNLTVQGVNALFPHVLAVAGVERDAKKPSPSEERTGSDTPSLSPSESP